MSTGVGVNRHGFESFLCHILVMVISFSQPYLSVMRSICGQTQVCCLFSCESDNLFLSLLFLCFLLPFTQVPKILLLKEQARWAASLSPRSFFEMQTLRFQHRDSKSESVFEHDSQVVHMHIKM